MGGSPIDQDTREMLEELSDGTSSFFDEVLETFMSDVDGALERLNAAYASDDRKGVRFHAHRFRSASASIGALVLSEHCAELEGIAEQDAGSLEAAWNKVQDETARVLSWVEVNRPTLGIAC
ncbi:MAG: Hpt domain-containing protein [Myxococcota bacterium]